jgi:hypothetical protein
MATWTSPPPFGPGCPWWEARERFGPPNVDWCERAVCGWASEPANTWSNLAYLLVALGCWGLARREGSRVLRHFAGTLGAVGLASLVYHASNNYLTQLLDFAGMYLVVFLLATLALHRLGRLRAERQVAVHAGLTLLGLGLIPPLRALGVPYQGLVLAGILFVIGAEWRLRGRVRARGAGHGRFLAGLALLTLAGVASALDVTRTVCLPDAAVLQGHAVWHVLSAASLGCTAAYFRQLERLGALAPVRAAVVRGG